MTHAFFPSFLLLSTFPYCHPCPQTPPGCSPFHSLLLLLLPPSLFPLSPLRPFLHCFLLLAVRNPSLCCACHPVAGYADLYPLCKEVQDFAWRMMHKNELLCVVFRLLCQKSCLAALISSSLHHLMVLLDIAILYYAARRASTGWCLQKWPLNLTDLSIPDLWPNPKLSSNQSLKKKPLFEQNWK